MIQRTKIMNLTMIPTVNKTEELTRTTLSEGFKMTDYVRNFTIHATTINEQPISIDLEILKRLLNLKQKLDS